ncbi:uncharacterized protein BX664DRAFT_329111 [Halteromyces radiatus]|uniref:uncharacterized protein n=1 Tax=Halteromyces radiatus TaxID=101107 RepID=UPI00221E69CD|nr:uncharacterized protein BX664DRAFT_329111 [Halteromyces radiatus]KAI8093185.1 hypothetical protein BX664DRAFT_329111 [Halteromyces radiatus]
MIKESPTITIKKDPEVLQEEQEDLILSYLNTDYVSTETTTDDPPSPPYSTSSASTDAAPSSTDMDYTPEQTSSLYLQDPFLLHLQTALNEQGLPLPWPSSTAALPTAPSPFGVQDPSCLMNIHPLFIPTTNTTTPLQPLYHPSFLQPQQNDIDQSKQPLSPRSSCSSTTSDTEQSKKKRGGRKKREVSIVPAPVKQLTRILPATANTNNSTTTTPATTPPATTPPPPQEDGHHVVKSESSVTTSLDQIPSPPHHTYQRASISSTTSNNSTQSPSNTTTEKTPAEIAYAKRQERLIKNRAAALLSRKRKREHLTTLEEERQQLMTENEGLKSKVSTLEQRVVSLEQENMELKRKLSGPPTISLNKQQQHHHHHHSLATPKHAKTTGMVFMIILFSFALFTLPSSHSSDQLTVGGGGGAGKPHMPLIGSSPSSVPEIRLDTVDHSTTTESTTTTTNSTIVTTDLMLMNHVQPGQLQSWIKEQLTSQKQEHPVHQETGLVQWRDSSSSSGHLYLYAQELSQVKPIQTDPLTATTTFEPTLSILCPLNTSSACERPSYLQIDVKVLGSRILDGELKQMNIETTTDRHNKNDSMMFDVKGMDKQQLFDHDDERRSLRRKKMMDDKRKRFSRVVLDDSI